MFNLTDFKLVLASVSMGYKSYRVAKVPRRLVSSQTLVTDGGLPSFQLVSFSSALHKLVISEVSERKENLAAIFLRHFKFDHCGNVMKTFQACFCCAKLSNSLNHKTFPTVTSICPRTALNDSE